MGVCRACHESLLIRIDGSLNTVISLFLRARSTGSWQIYLTKQIFYKKSAFLLSPYRSNQIHIYPVYPFPRSSNSIPPFPPPSLPSFLRPPTVAPRYNEPLIRENSLLRMNSLGFYTPCPHTIGPRYKEFLPKPRYNERKIPNFWTSL